MADLKLSVDVSDVQKALTATQRYERQINQLAQRYARGQVSSEAYNRGLLQIKRSYEQLGVSSQKATSEVRRYAQQQLQAAKDIQQAAIAQNNLAAATQQSTGRMNRMNVVTQQAGYQIGDFLVQVQSGTNPMVAFGQQATQLAGVMTLFGGKMILIGSILGIVIPLLTAVGAAFMRTRGAADSATGGFTTMEAAMKSAREESGRMADEIERLNLGLKNNTELNLTRAIAEQTKRVADAQALADQVAGTDGGFVAEQRLAREQETLREYQQQLQTLKDQAEQIDNINDAREQEVENAREQIELQAQYRESLRRTQRQQLEALLEAGRIAEEGRQTREDIARTLEREAELYREIARFGEDSVQVEELRAQQARAAHLARIQETTTNEVLIRQAMERYDAMVQTREEADRVTSALEQVESANLSSFNDQVRMLATLLGTSADEAARLLSNLPVGMTFGDRGALTGYTGSELLPPPRREPRQRGGAGGQDPLQQLREQIRLEEELLGKTEAQQRVIRALGVDWENYGEGTVNSLVAAIEEMDRFNQQVEQQQRLADSIAGSFGDAFMSVVDGTKSTKDAFRSMAADIIKELYRVLVVQRMVGAISGALGPGGSAGGFLGRLLGGRESGGSMMANRPYIVGERGPELVIPGRSSTVTNADLTNKAMGGGETVIVNQTINVSTGVQQTVRNEIKQLMPQIAESAKQAVVDSKRRGGSYGRAFS